MCGRVQGSIDRTGMQKYTNPKLWMVPRTCSIQYLHPPLLIIAKLKRCAIRSAFNFQRSRRANERHLWYTGWACHGRWKNVVSLDSVGDSLCDFFSNDQHLAAAMSHPRYEDINTIAENGTFGKAVLVRRKTDGKSFVKKTIQMSLLSEPPAAHVLGKFGKLVQLRHPNLARLREALIVGSADSSADDKMVVIYDFVGEGLNLAQGIERKRGDAKLFTEAEVVRILLQIILGLKELHDIGIPHGNLKPANVFLECPHVWPGTSSQRTLVKVSDFGIKTYFGDAATGHVRPDYEAPEHWRQGVPCIYTPASDIWSLGCIIFECLTLNRPFSGHDFKSMHAQVRANPQPVKLLPEHVNGELKSLLATMLNNNPNKRPTVDSILLLPFLQEPLEDLMAAILDTGLNNPSPESVRVAPRLSRTDAHVRPSTSNAIRTTFQVSDESIRLALENEKNAFKPKQKIIRSPVNTVKASPPKSIQTDLSIGTNTTSSLSPSALNAAAASGRRREEKRLASPTNKIGQSTNDQKQTSYEEMLAVARIEAYEQRKALESKMQNLHGRPVSRQRAIADQQPPPPAPSAVFDEFYSESEDRLQQRQQCDSRAAKKELENRKHLEALAKARVEAFKDRKRLEEKMRGMGGRPVNQSVEQQGSQSPLRQNSGVARSPTNSSNAVNTHVFSAPATLPDYETASKTKKNAAYQRESKKQMEAEEHAKALARARKENFEERKALEQKMREMGGRPARVQRSVSHAHPRDPQYQALKRSASNPEAFTVSPTRQAKLRQQRRKEAERQAHMDALADARKEAFLERQALKVKMREHGGRPTVSSVTSNGSHENRVHVHAMAEQARHRRASKKEEEQEAHKQALAKARREAYEDRMKLRQQYGNGRPTKIASAAPTWQDPQPVNEEDIVLHRNASPFALDESSELSKSPRSRETARRLAMKQRVAEEEEYTKALEQARIDAFQERQMLKQRYGR